ncbi:MAG: hypothetical protein ACOY82_07785 [Pseudomonadota bacterium]
MSVASIRLLLVVCILSAAALAPCRAQDLESTLPGTIYHGPMLDVAVPDGTGWMTIDNGVQGRLFERRGERRHTTIIASATFFPLEPNLDDAGFEAQVRADIAHQAAEDRFEPVESSVSYDESRGYPCIVYAAVVRDTAAQVGGDRTRDLILEMRALYCRHPHDAALAFALIYSHRGKQRDPAFAAAAEGFFAGAKPTPAITPPLTE